MFRENLIERQTAENSSSAATFACGIRSALIGQPRISGPTNRVRSKWQVELGGPSYVSASW